MDGSPDFLVRLLRELEGNENLTVAFEGGDLE